MKQDVKERWIKALRSSEYEQGYGHLYVKNEGYCCLGVLADVEDMWGNKKVKGSSKVLSSANEFLGPLQREQIELDYDDMYKLVELNDDEEASFNEIADWIERNL